MMACLAGPSFHDGSGSAACANPVANIKLKTIVLSRFFIELKCMSALLPMVE
jgi:hypothetical protein